MALSYHETGRGKGVPASPETRSFLHRSGVIFERVKFNSPVQVAEMKIHSGVNFTPEQEQLYIDLRDRPLDGKIPSSDQALLAQVLEQTGGPVDVFKAAYSHILKWN